MFLFYIIIDIKFHFRCVIHLVQCRLFVTTLLVYHLIFTLSTFFKLFLQKVYSALQINCFDFI